MSCEKSYVEVAYLYESLHENMLTLQPRLHLPLKLLITPQALPPHQNSYEYD